MTASQGPGRPTRRVGAAGGRGDDGTGRDGAPTVRHGTAHGVDGTAHGVDERPLTAGGAIPTPPTRRGFLAAVGLAASVGTAGCLDGVASDGPGDAGAEQSGDDADEEEPDGEPLAEHPVADGIEDRPRRGPDPFEAPATIVVFDDPSCPSCARFHQQTVESLVDDHAAAGELSVVVRPYPVIYEWASPASHALEATHDRDEDAFWGLLAHYFEEQSAYGSDDVYERTASWLADETALDASAVVEDAREEVYADRIEATFDAADEAGLGRSTPTTYAFLDGEFQTAVSGAVSTTTVETILEL